jgi:toxin YoeB
LIVAFSNNGWEDYLYWQKTDKKILKRVNLLIEDIKRNPSDSEGIGKPEKLKENLSGYYSRRVTSEHRLIYKVEKNYLIIAQCRFHY